MHTNEQIVAIAKEAGRQFAYPSLQVCSTILSHISWLFVNGRKCAMTLLSVPRSAGNRGSQPESWDVGID